MVLVKVPSPKTRSLSYSHPQLLKSNVSGASEGDVFWESKFTNWQSLRPNVIVRSGNLTTCLSL